VGGKCTCTWFGVGITVEPSSSAVRKLTVWNPFVVFCSLHHSFASGKSFVSEQYNTFSITLNFIIKNLLAISGKWRPALGLLTIVKDSLAINSGLRFQKYNKVFHNTRVKIINRSWVLYHMATIQPHSLALFAVPRKPKT
jgi:hypothetical protein